MTPICRKRKPPMGPTNMPRDPKAVPVGSTCCRTTDPHEPRCASAMARAMSRRANRDDPSVNLLCERAGELSASRPPYLAFPHHVQCRGDAGCIPPGDVEILRMRPPISSPAKGGAHAALAVSRSRARPGDDGKFTPTLFAARCPGPATSRRRPVVQVEKTPYRRRHHLEEGQSRWIVKIAKSSGRPLIWTASGY